MRRAAGVTGVLLAALVVALPTAALAGGHAQASATHTVVIKNYLYNPGRMTINRGDSVTWRFADGGIAHNVSGKGFRSPTKASGSFTARFTRSGTFSYTCTIHPWMSGSIVVRR